MTRLAWSQLRFRTVRLIALLAGMLLATTAFTVLTAASRTAQLRTTGTVSAHFVPAYDILVRPKGGRTTLETQTGTVQPNFLSGIFGGITMPSTARSPPSPASRSPRRLPWSATPAGLAAVFPAARCRPEPARPAPLPVHDARGSREGGTNRVTQPPSYLYLTPERLGFDLDATVIGPKIARTTTQTELLPDGKNVTICPAAPSLNPASIRSAWPRSRDCLAWSKVNGYGPGAVL